MKVFAGLTMQKTGPELLVGQTAIRHRFEELDFFGRASVSRAEVLKAMTEMMPPEVQGGVILFFCAEPAEITAEGSADV